MEKKFGYISAIISGKNPLRLFKGEIGKHCVQRVPPTESAGRRQTSMLSVAVLEINDGGIEAFDDKDVLIETYNAGGKGGQHSNKSDSAVRAKHIPSGIIVSINGRSQHKNKVDALKILKAKVKGLEEEKVNNEKQNSKREQISNIGRGNKVRTYNFIDSRVVDHRTGKKSKQIKKIMKGRFDCLK